MRLSRMAAVSAFLVIAIGSSSSALFNQQKVNSSNSQAGTQRVIVKMRNVGVRQKSGYAVQNGGGQAEVRALAAQFAATKVEALEIGAAQLHQGGELGEIQVVEFASSEAARDFIAACSSAPGIEYAEPDYPLEFFDLPNDQYFEYQWNLRNVGQNYYSVHRFNGDNNDTLTMVSGISGADIKATELPSSNSSDSAVVAIIDSGIDRMHPDLSGVIWRNVDEVAGNSIDDDHNGYVDDTWGWDFSANPKSVPIYSDSDPTDPFGHGSHCAGIVAAATNNQIGVAGVSTHARLMALKIWPTMSISLAARAVIYAADNGADVISMSWGTAYESLLLREALLYARSKGVVLCAASGNSGTEAAFFPAAYDFVIAVGATSSRDGVTEFSTYGNHIDICAPGESILSLRAGGTDMYAESPSNEPNVHVVANQYYEASGTSMACPHVAGAAAELKAHSPGLAPSRVEEILCGSCDDIVDPRGDGSTLPGKDKYSGYGRLNVRQALESTPRVAAIIDAPVEGAILSGQIVVSGSALAQAGQNYTLQYRHSDSENWIELKNGAAQVSHAQLIVWDTEQLEGAYELRLQVGESNVIVRKVLIVSQPRVEFIDPVEGQLVSGAAELMIVAVCPNFESATLDYRPAGGTAEWEPIAELTEPKIGDESIFWDSSLLGDGDYFVRIRVFSQSGLADSAMISISLSSPFAGSRGWRVPIGFTPSIVPNYGDFDGDGKNEIVVGTEIGVNFYNLDGTRKTTGVPIVPYGSYLLPPVVCSFDGDSIDDLVVMKENVNAVFGFASSGAIFDTSSYNEPQTWRYSTVKESHFPLLFAIDLDNDHKDELIYKSGRGPNTDEDLVVFSPSGDENANSCFPLDLDCSVVQPADLDGDKIYEIYTANLNGSIRKINLCGQTVNELYLGGSDWTFVPTGMSAVDMTGDGIQELAIMGYISVNSNDLGYMLLAVDSRLRIVNGATNYFGIPSSLDPPMAVFGDIDGDQEPEAIVSFHDANYGYVFAWHLNGEPVIVDQPMPGLLGVTAHAGICAMPLLVDVDQSRGAEVMCPTGRDLFGTFPRQRIEAFNSAGTSVSGWPLYVAPHGQEHLTKANIPVYGDINQDGFMDMMIITPANELAFTTFDNVPWDEERAPCPMWRYNRRLNNVVPSRKDVAVAVTEDDIPLPTAFLTAQNFPNPFNLSTKIEFNLPSKSEVKIDVYNVLGQSVVSAKTEALTAGRHEYNWEATGADGTALPSGVYFYKITANGSQVTGKMMLLK